MDKPMVYKNPSKWSLYKVDCYNFFRCGFLFSLEMLVNAYSKAFQLLSHILLYSG